jgi:zinc transporter ZupT
MFHEIPHELGDYGVLISAGFHHWTAIFLNSVTSFVCLIAFLIISASNPEEVVREWIFAVTTGVFLYLALANMVN